MCGRYSLYGPVSRLRETFDAVPVGRLRYPVSRVSHN